MDNSITKKANKFRTLLVLAMVTALSLGVFLFRGSEVVLNIDGTAFTVVTNAKTVEELVEEEDIIKEDAYIDLALETEIETGLEIDIKNPKTYTIGVKGTQLEISSVHTEVGKILEDAGIEVGDLDYTEPHLNEEVPGGTEIKYYHVEIVDEIEETSIPFEEQKRNNNKLEKGKTKKVQDGKEGLKKTEIERRYVNGTLVSSTVLNEEVAVEPQASIVEVGTMVPKPVVKKASTSQAKASTSSKQAQPSRGNARKTITMAASAYDLSYESTGKRPGDKYYGITASGTKARPGVVAVDPRVIPLGTKLYIESLDGSSDYGYAVAEDTGGAIKGNRIDLFYSSRSAALNFGRRNVKVHILN